MNIATYISSRIRKETRKNKSISRPIVKIAQWGISIGMIVMILTISISLGFKNEIIRKVSGFGSHLIINQYDDNNSPEPEPISDEQQFLPELKKHPNIRFISPYATKTGIIKTDSENEGILLKGIDKNYPISFFQQQLIAGKMPNFNDSIPSKDLLISLNLSHKLGLQLGDKTIIYFMSQKTEVDSLGQTIIKTLPRKRDFNICGIFQTGYSEFDNKLIIGDLRQIQRINFWTPHQISGFEIQVHQFEQLEKTHEDLYDYLSQGLDIKSIKQTQPAIFSWLIPMDKNAQIIIILMIIVATINMISALIILILEKTSMIGLLKAMGAHNGQVRSIFLVQTMHIILRGLFWGNAIGLLLAWLQKTYHWVKLNQATYYVPYVPVEINAYQVLALNLLTFVICTFMMVLPSLIISKINPIKTIRFR